MPKLIIDKLLRAEMPGTVNVNNNSAPCSLFMAKIRAVGQFKTWQVIDDKLNNSSCFVTAKKNYYPVALDIDKMIAVKL